MNKQQFKRLTLVLALPLVGLGVWLASEEILFEMHHTTYCEEFSTHFSCASINASKYEANAAIWDDQAVSILASAVLVNRFNHQVRTLGLQQMVYENGAMREGAITGAGIVKQLVLPRPQDSGRKYGASCQLIPFANATNKWSVNCMSIAPDSFEFMDNATAEKFDGLAKTVLTERERLSDKRVKLFVLATITPLLSYFALSLLALIGGRLVRFVRGPASRASETAKA